MGKKVIIYTDGACSGNPGPGGWGAHFECEGKTKAIKGSEKSTTNNRMELMAVIQALNTLKSKSEVELHTDSKYVMNGITTWIKNWKKNNWRTANKKEVKNKDLWQALDEAVAKHEITWKWVKGHSGDAGNELADELATSARDAA